MIKTCLLEDILSRNPSSGSNYEDIRYTQIRDILQNPCPILLKL